MHFALHQSTDKSGDCSQCEEMCLFLVLRLGRTAGPVFGALHVIRHNHDPSVVRLDSGWPLGCLLTPVMHLFFSSFLTSLLNFSYPSINCISASRVK